MLYREIMAVCSEIHRKYINTTAVYVKWRKLALNLLVPILTTTPYSGSYYLQLHTYKLTLPLECMAVSLPNKNLVFFSGKSYEAV